MRTKEFLDSVKFNCHFLEEEGYRLRDVDPGLNRNFWFEKHNDKEGFRISFAWTQYGDEFHVSGLHALKRFNSVEQALQKLLGRDLVDYYTIHTESSTGYIPDGLPYRTTGNNIHFVLRNEHDVKLFSEFVKNFYSIDVKAFYAKYESFEKVYSDYKDLPREKISSLISGSGNTIFYRELSMKNIVNAEDKKLFYDMVVAELEPLKDSRTFSEMLDNFKLLAVNLGN